MKRSEMLEIIEYSLSNYMGEKLNHPDVLANVVLDEVEKYMLPPLIENHRIGKTSDFVNEDRYVNEWDLDDE